MPVEQQKFRVLFQGEALTWRTTDPEYLFKRGEVHFPPAQVISKIRGVPGFVVEEMEDAPPVAEAPKREKVK